MNKKNSDSKNYFFSAAIAKQFGFQIQQKNPVSDETIKTCKKIKNHKNYLAPYLPSIEEVSELILEYKEKEKESGVSPILKYFDQPSGGNFNKHRKRSGENQINLSIVGIENSIADALVIKTILSILEEDGQKKLKILINNIGEKEAQTQFIREATAFFRKHIELLNADCRQYFKDSVHSLITDGGQQCKIVKENAPTPIEFIEDENRDKFKTLVEFLESFNTTYEINNDLLGDINASSNVIFQIIDEKNEKVLASGSRYDILSKKLGIRKSIPCISANCWIGKTKTVTSKQLNKTGPKFFLIQIGDKAKITALYLLQKLQKENIRVEHRVYRDKLSPQIQLASKKDVDYLITIGHKEALDQTAIVRDSQGKAQRIIDINELGDYLKSLK